MAAAANRLRLQASVNSVGAVALAGKITAGGLGEARFEDAVTLRARACCWFRATPRPAKPHLLRTLEANQFDFDRAPGGIPEKLDDYQLVVVNNWDMERHSRRAQGRARRLRQAGRRPAVDRRRAQRLRREKGEEDPLERTLPARLAPPRSPEGTAVVLVIDKSSSMEGRKIELARLAAIGVVENLRPIDSVGVLIFDNSFQWAVPIRKAEDRAYIKRLISGIVADGGTQIAPASPKPTGASSAARRLQAHRAPHRRHFRGRRQLPTLQASARQPRHHFHRRPGTGREPRVSGKGRVHSPTANRTS